MFKKSMEMDKIVIEFKDRILETIGRGKINRYFLNEGNDK